MPTITVGATTRAVDFLDGCGSSGHWDYLDTTYAAKKAALIDLIKKSGLKRMRGYDKAVSPELAKAGIRTMHVVGPEYGTPYEVVAFVRKVNAGGIVIDALEGPNEPDLFWGDAKHRWQGKGFPDGVVLYMQDLAKALRAAPDLAYVKVIGPSLGKTYDPNGGFPNPFAPIVTPYRSGHDAVVKQGLLAPYVDYGNFHPYPGGNPFSAAFAYGGIKPSYYSLNPMPSAALDEFPANFRTYQAPYLPKPMVATETGYNNLNCSDAAKAKYVPRLFAEYWRLGIRQTYLYEFADLKTNQDRECNWGLVRADGTPRPAYTALQSLLALVAFENRPITKTQAMVPEVEVTMPKGYDRPGYVHSIVLQQSDHSWLLLLWHEVASSISGGDAGKRWPDIAVPEGKATVTLPAGATAYGWYAYDAAWKLAKTNIGKRSVIPNVPLRDSIVAVLIKRAS